MKKLLIFSMVCAVGLAALPAWGSIFTLGLSDLTLEKYKPDAQAKTWDDNFYLAGDTDGARYWTKLNVGTTPGGYRGAAVWTCPENEVITQVTFHLWYSLLPTNWAPSLFDLSSGDPLDDTTTVLQVLDDEGDGSKNHDYVLNYSTEDALESIGFGFTTPVSSYQEWGMKYSLIEVTTTSTIPEPGTLVALALGFVGTFLKKFRS